MKILILTNYLENYEPLAETTNKNKMDYCRYWNCNGKDYAFMPWIGWYGGVSQTLCRIPLMIHLIKNTIYDVVFFTDCDGMIMNYTITIESILDEHSVYFTQDCMGINGGMIISRTNADALKFWQFLESKMPDYSGGAEQSIVNNCCLGDEWKDILKVCQQRQFNSYFEDLYERMTPGNFEKGDFIVHWPACSMEHRIQLATSDRVKENMVFPKNFVSGPLTKFL